MRSGPSFLVERLKWSPRPISEPLYCGYGWLVNHLHHSLIVPLLAVLWTIFLLAGLITSWQNRGKNRAGRQPLLLLSLALMALFLAGGHTTEVFYWPAGAIAYIPTVAATLLLFLQVVDGRLDSSSGRAVACFCLVVAGGSSEAGATFVLCYGVLQAVHWAYSLLRKQPALDRRTILWWAIPTALALALLLVVRLNRFMATELPELTGRPTYGHPLASLIVGLKTIVKETLGMESLRPSVRALLHSRIPMEILLALGVAYCWFQLGGVSKRLAWQILEVAAALAMASVFVIAAANLHFGVTCCDRHLLLRQCWIIMGAAGVVIASTAWISAQSRQRLARASFLAPLLLCAAVVSLGFIRPLLHTYRLYPEMRSAIAQNFASGFNPNGDVMFFSVLPSLGIVWEEPLGPGTYKAFPGQVTGFSSRLYPYYILGFFNKQVLIVSRFASEIDTADSRRSYPQPSRRDDSAKCRKMSDSAGSS